MFRTGHPTGHCNSDMILSHETSSRYRPQLRTRRNCAAAAAASGSLFIEK